MKKFNLELSRPKIIIRADGNAQMGMGHIHRTLALADYLSEVFEIEFCLLNADDLCSVLIQNKNYKIINLKDPDYSNPKIFLKEIDTSSIVVIDGYNFRTEYQKAIMENGNKVVAIDDLNEWEQVADVVINHGYSAPKNDYLVSKRTKLYTGLDYVLLKKEFIEATFTGKRNLKKNILVCIGGTDPKNYSKKILEELLSKTDKQIHLITYSNNAHFDELKSIAEKNWGRVKLHESVSTIEMVNLILENDLAILQPSNIALEAASLGIYIGLIKTAENQKFILESLLSKNCAEEVDENNISVRVNSVSENEILKQIENQNKLIDKKSPARIQTIFTSLALEIRKVKKEDSEILFKWANDPLTRSNSYNQTEINYDSHVNWLSKKVVDENSCFLIVEWNKIPAGTVRIDCSEKENVIGITMASEFRGKKLSATMLDKACNYFFDNFNKQEITAYIKEGNNTSLKTFERAGFKVMDKNEYFGTKSYRLIKIK